MVVIPVKAGVQLTAWMPNTTLHESLVANDESRHNFQGGNHEKKRRVQQQGFEDPGVLVTPECGKGPFPIAVMGGGWCYVKEIVLPHYAEAIVKAGVAVLMFDYRGLGESEGEPRQHIDPWGQVEDYKNAISFVMKQPEIDPNRVGIWGISYAGGHVVIVGATDPRVKCIVSTVPVVEGWETMKRCHGERKFEKLLRAGDGRSRAPLRRPARAP